MDDCRECIHARLKIKVAEGHSPLDLIAANRVLFPTTNNALIQYELSCRKGHWMTHEGQERVLGHPKALNTQFILGQTGGQCPDYEPVYEEETVWVD